MRKIKLLFIVILSSVIGLQAQEPMNYQQPPKAILDLVDAPAFPGLLISPNKEYMVFLERSGYPDISEVAEQEERLAGIRLNPLNFGPSRSYYSIGITTRKMGSDQESVPNGLPDEPKISETSFNAAGTKLAFVQTKQDELELWVLDLSSNIANLVGSRLNSTIGRAYTWLDNDQLIYKQRTDAPASKPKANSLPQGPAVQQSGGTAAPVRTYQDLLSTPEDERVFDYYTQSTLVKVDLRTMISKPLNISGIISGLSTSPDGQYVMVTSIQKPYSYIVPYYRFPDVTNIHDPNGKMLSTFNTSPLTENIPKGFSAVPTGKRSISWRADKPATLYWVEALDGGDPANEVPFRDQIFMQELPTGKTIEGPKCSLRYAGITWGNESIALMDEYWWSSRQIITRKWNPANPGAEPTVLFDRSREDRYNDPGSFVTGSNEYGMSVLTMTSDDKLLLTGAGASPEGNRPFIDVYDHETQKTERLWRSEAPFYEVPVTLLDAEKGEWITRRESTNIPPNYFIRTLGKDELEPITDFGNPYESLSQIGKELVTYERADGLKLSGTLYTPAGYDKEKDGPLPVFMWAYPREFKSADAASQMTTSPYEFIRLNWGSALYWVTQGYAIFDNFSMPILGEGDQEPNETFVKQLRLSAEAAIDALVDMGVADRQRIAVGGHSYGAFMTANLLAHTDLFAAGIARSGAYNRTLTPFGFQAEQRTYWEAPEIYYDMSPFNYAHKIKSPILLIHGDSDNNSGTFPMQSERFFAALKGHGATARLVMLPHESHGYRARQSVLHTLWEMNQWLDTHVKNRPTQQP